MARSADIQVALGVTRSTCHARRDCAASTPAATAGTAVVSGRHAGLRPAPVGLVMVVLGALIEAVVIALGG